MATLYVNADHGSASDAGNYLAAQNAATPLETIGRGMVLAQLGDTINVLHATTANPADTKDTSVYALVLDDISGGAIIPNQDASGGRITVQGVDVGGQQPKWLGINAYGLNNWHFDNFQWGYDLDSGDDYNTTNSLLGLTDCLFTNILYTAGVCNLLGFVGHNRWEDCEVISKLSVEPGSFMEGVGVRVLHHYDDTYTAGPDDWVEFINVHFHDVQGEDALQFLGTNGIGNALVEDCIFDNMQQAGEAHTDAIQTTGITQLIVRRCAFGPTGIVASMVIGTDGQIGTLIMENNVFVGRVGESGYSTQFGGGVEIAVIRHNTWIQSGFGGLRFHRQTPSHDLFGTTSVLICNNLIDKYQIDITPTWDETDQFNNVISAGPRMSADIDGFPEYGATVDTEWELANDPIDSLGVDFGAVTDILTDRLGRPRFGSAPDCGCHESNPAVSVIAGPRAPILTSINPYYGQVGVDESTMVSATFYPKPGEELDPATFTTASFYVVDAAGGVIPAIVTMDPIDEDGFQTVSLDLKSALSPAIEGALYPLVLYYATITGAVEDTQGSAYPGFSWPFRIAGPFGPAIRSATPFTVGVLPNGTFVGL